MKATWSALPKTPGSVPSELGLPVPISNQDMSEHALKAIELEQLVKRFGDLTAVDDLRFTVNEGEIFGRPSRAPMR